MEDTDTVKNFRLNFTTREYEVQATGKEILGRKGFHFGDLFSCLMLYMDSVVLGNGRHPKWLTIY